MPTSRTVLTSRSQAVHVGQQLGLGNSWISHQADVDVTLREKNQNRSSVAGFTWFDEGKCFIYFGEISTDIDRGWWNAQNKKY